MTVWCRGQRCVVLDAQPLVTDASAGWRLSVQAVDGPLRGQKWPVLSSLEPLRREDPPQYGLKTIGREARFRLLHEAFQLSLAPPADALLGQARIRFWAYQYIPAFRMLSLPRPRILNASDVGLGKTIETGICLRELIARRRGNRILILCPANLVEQWQEELASKFGLEFAIFDRDGVLQARRQIDVGVSPWATEPRIIASFDFAKRRDGVLRELQNVRFDVIVCDEAHHLADNTQGEDYADRHRLAQWASRAADALLLLTATPHSGYDESFVSLLNLLEPTLVPDVTRMQYRQYARHLIRHLKRHIKKPDGTALFVQPLPAKPIPVPMMAAEQAVHEAVSKQARNLEDQAEKMKAPTEKYAIRLVATILRKRAASSLAALHATVDSRLENLGRTEEKLEVRRDHLRAIRRGDTIRDDDLSQLEVDAHRTLLGYLRAAGKSLRTIEQERKDLLSLRDLLAACPTESDAKAEALLAELRGIHKHNPHDKVIVFSEYADTIHWVANYLERHGYAGKIVHFDGSLTSSERKTNLAQFARPEPLLLLTTDAASEGLNLQDHCHRVIHYELPFNPNRMLQRQGRVDRFGQEVAPEFAYLYAAETYEGEVLHRLFMKIERQVQRLGSVGDVLGSLQSERIEQMLATCPTDIRAAVKQAEKQIDQELASLDNAGRKQMLGDDGLSTEELASVACALDAGRKLQGNVPGFLLRAIRLAGGKADRKDDILVIPQVPNDWVGGRVKNAYDALYASFDAAPRNAPMDDILHDHHPLVQAAIRWLRETRYRPENGLDHRMAVRVEPSIKKADLIVTFLATLRSQDGTEMDRMMAVRVATGGIVDDADCVDAIFQEGQPANITPPQLTTTFGSWWEGGLSKALAIADERARLWHDQIRQRRIAEHGDLKQKLEEWNGVTRAAILHNEDDPASLLFAGYKNLPPTTARLLREHEKEVQHRLEMLDKHLAFEAPTVEHLGILFRIPASEVR